MGTFQSFRKAYGALKDSTKVGLAKVNSEFKELDIAIVKATNHVELPPKERHVRKIFYATSVVRPRADVAYCIHALSKRLSKTKNWIVALKTLIVIHRTLREGDPTFREELLNYSPRGYIIQMTHFKDDSSPLAWDCSAWVRTYSQFLEERLECYRVLRYDIETERLTKTSPSSSKAHSRTRLLSNNELLVQLPALQRLLYRLIGCQPEGAAYCNYLIQYALALVLKESFKIYCAINDGIINLVDMFFDMPRYDAVKALEIYRRAGQQAENLAEFYDYCKRLEVARNFQFPMLRLPPPSFLTTMEEYIREAPYDGSLSSKRLDYRGTEESPREEDEDEEEEAPQLREIENEVENIKEEEEKELINLEEEEAKKEPEAPPLVEAEGDLLGLIEVNPKALELEQSNAIALAIIPHGTDDPSSSSANNSNNWDLTLGSSSSGWELALVTTPSNNTRPPVESKLGGGFDKLLLDSLYEDAASRRQIQMTQAGYGFGHMPEASAANPFEQSDPFMTSNHIAAPTNVQMAMMAQHQQTMFQPQQQQQQQHYPYGHYEEQQQQRNMNMNMMMVPHQNLNSYQQSPNCYPQQPNNPNPFGDPFPSFPPQQPLRSHDNHYLL